jgi:hypothetical protein
MRKIPISVLAIFCSASLLAVHFPPLENENEIQGSIKFLTSGAEEAGSLYFGTCGELDKRLLPLSFYSTPEYWAKYVGTLPGNNLTVVDIFAPWTLTPSPNLSVSPGSNLQVERINAFNGSNIYDGACWQIALAVYGKATQQLDILDVAENQTLLLTKGYDGNADKADANVNRATTKGKTFSYNGVSITNPREAYFFRMIPRSYVSTDPLINLTEGKQYLSIKGKLPPEPTPFALGKVTWMDWKPITGENGWAFFVGPLQLERIRMEANSKSCVSFDSPAVQNAMDVLVAFQNMQSPLGGLYYACGGSLGNQGDHPVNPHQISVENNFSVLAGLLLLQETLHECLKYDHDLTEAQKAHAIVTLKAVEVMIFGGETIQGYHTDGLLAFFKDHAWDKKNGIFRQGGLANQPDQPEWIPEDGLKAVDVSTWGAAVLGQQMIDSWFGFGSAFHLWENVKSWGGYYGPDGALWGVGYSDKDGNGKEADYRKGINSGEWSAGAINLLRCLITQYGEVSVSALNSAEEQAEAKKIILSLQKDHDSLFKNLMSLRSDNYEKSPAYEAVRPANYSSLIPMPADTIAFLYASKRYMIPFGWFANPIPSTTSTAWAIMLHYNFNPFHPKGKYQVHDIVRVGI